MSDRRILTLSISQHGFTARDHKVTEVADDGVSRPGIRGRTHPDTRGPDAVSPAGSTTSEVTSPSGRGLYSWWGRRRGASSHQGRRRQRRAADDLRWTAGLGHVHRDAQDPHHSEPHQRVAPRLHLPAHDRCDPRGGPLRAILLRRRSRRRRSRRGSATTSPFVTVEFADRSRLWSSRTGPSALRPTFEPHGGWLNRTHESVSGHCERQDDAGHC